MASDLPPDDPILPPDDALPGRGRRSVRPDGPRVRRERVLRDWTQADLARRAGYGKRTVEKIEASQPVWRSTLAEVAEALGVSLECLIDRTPPDPCPTTWRHDPTPEPLPPPHADLTPPRLTLLVVDDQAEVLDILRRTLQEEFDVVTAESADAAERVIRSRPVHLVLTDQRMPGRTGVDLLRWVHDYDPCILGLLMTGFADMHETIDAINVGHVYHYFTKPWCDDELRQALRHAAERIELQQSRTRLLRELEREKQRLQEQLEREAITDPLTGLYNSRLIEELARREVHHQTRYGSPLSIGLIDVDQFDAAGIEHLRCRNEAALRDLTRLFRQELRRGDDSVGRLDGARFLVVARQTAPEGATELANRLLRACHDRDLPVTLSIGFAAADGGEDADLDDFLDVACAALAEAHEAGGNRAVVRRVPRPLMEDG